MGPGPCITSEIIKEKEPILQSFVFCKAVIILDDVMLIMVMYVDRVYERTKFSSI